MSLVTDNEEVLDKKDAEGSSKFLSATEPNPSSKQSSSPAEKQKASNQPRKTQANSSVHKVFTVQLHLQDKKAVFGFISSV